MAHRDNRRSILALLLVVTALVPLLFIISTTSNPTLKDNLHRQLWLFGNPSGKNDSLLLARYADPKSVRNTNDRRKNCQIIYVLGVEGSIHHGFMPIIRKLAEQQVDPITGTPYHVIKGHATLRDTIFGSHELIGSQESNLPLNDPKLVQSTVSALCPASNEIWKNHVIIEGNSFPSGGADNLQLPFRVRRQKDWINMSPAQIAASELALNHPTNLYDLYDAFSPFVDVRFIVLHRPYLETIASHIGFDEGPESHSNVISGFLMLLSQFLIGHKYSSLDGSVRKRGGVPLWTIVCADKLSSKQYDTQHQVNAAREHVVGYLANFMGWPQQSCPMCFDEWKESTKISTAEERLGEEMTMILGDRVKDLEGIWPPRRREDSLHEQHCRA